MCFDSRMTLPLSKPDELADAALRFAAGAGLIVFTVGVSFAVSMAGALIGLTIFAIPLAMCALAMPGGSARGDDHMSAARPPLRAEVLNGALLVSGLLLLGLLASARGSQEFDPLEAKPRCNSLTSSALAPSHSDQ